VSSVAWTCGTVRKLGIQYRLGGNWKNIIEAYLRPTKCCGPIDTLCLNPCPLPLSILATTWMATATEIRHPAPCAGGAGGTESPAKSWSESTVVNFCSFNPPVFVDFHWSNSTRPPVVPAPATSASPDNKPLLYINNTWITGAWSRWWPLLTIHADQWNKIWFDFNSVMSIIMHDNHHHFMHDKNQIYDECTGWKQSTPTLWKYILQNYNLHVIPCLFGSFTRMFLSLEPIKPFHEHMMSKLPKQNWLHVGGPKGDMLFKWLQWQGCYQSHDSNYHHHDPWAHPHFNHSIYTYLLVI